VLTVLALMALFGAALPLTVNTVTSRPAVALLQPTFDGTAGEAATWLSHARGHPSLFGQSADRQTEAGSS